jgi:hypothetical protein
MTFQRLPAADLWWHLASGRYILENGRIPGTDPFSFTAQGGPWMNHEWLSQVIFYLLYRLGGLNLLVIFKSLLITLSAWIVFRLAVWICRFPPLAALVVLLSLLCARTTFFFDVRPYIFSYLLAAVFLYCLDRFSRENSSSLVLLLVPLTFLWANLHAAFPLGLALTGVYLVSSALRGRWKAAGTLACVLLASTLASGLTPFGFKPLLYPLSFMKSDTFRAALSDWTPPDLLGNERAFGLFLALELLLAFLSRKTLRSEQVLVMSLMGLLGLSAVRHVFLACLLSAPILAGLLGSLFSEKYKSFSPGRPATVIYSSAFLLLAAASGIFIFKNSDPEGLLMEGRLFPVEAVGFLKANPPPGRLFAPYEWGGYLIWKLYPDQKVFIDGRANSLYTEKTYRDALDVMWGRPGWDEILAGYGVDFVLCNKMQVERGMLLPWRLLHSSAEWQLVHSDDIAMLFTRRSPRNADFLRKYRAGQLLYPPSPRLLYNRGQAMLREGRPGEAGKLFREALRMDVRQARSWIALGYVQASEGRYLEAGKSFKRALFFDPEALLAHYNLGRLYQREGRKKMARREFERELEMNPGFKEAREALRELVAP